MIDRRRQPAPLTPTERQAIETAIATLQQNLYRTTPAYFQLSTTGQNTYATLLRTINFTTTQTIETLRDALR